MHERVHAGGSEKRRDIRRAFGLPIRSLRLGLSGKADVVEFHRQPDGGWRPYPVEYKRGRRKEEDWDRVQVCAQAICLEEMLDVSVPEGALFYGAEQRREVVPLDPALRQRTEDVALAVHELMAAGRTPTHDPSPACKSCSLYARCLPGTGGRSGKRVARYIERMTVEP
jgi:CRISPR-associated exonuclease Cas4